MNFTVVLTEKCNLRCEYCYERKKRNLSMNNDIQKKTLDFIIKKIKSEVCTDRIHRIILHGSEPLLNYESIEFFVNNIKNTIKGKNIIFEMTTNGTIYEEYKFDFISKNIDCISISIDGDEYSHNYYRKFIDGTGSYSTLERNIRKIKSHNVYLRARMTISHNNVKRFYEDIKHIINKGFDAISIALNTYDDWSEEDFYYLGEELKKTKLYIKKNKIKTPISIFDTNEVEEPKGSCFGGVTTFCISPNGKIYPCVYSLGIENMEIGNVKEGNIYEKKINKLQELNYNNKKCHDCDRIDYCDGNRCKIINIIMSGNPFNPDGLNCMYQYLITELYWRD